MKEVSSARAKRERPITKGVSTLKLLKSSKQFLDKKDHKWLYIGLVMSVFQSIFYAGGTGLTGLIIKLFFPEEIVANNGIGFDMKGFVIANIALGLSFILYVVFRILQGKLLIAVSFKMACNMREKATTNLLFMPISYHDGQKAGEQISTLTNDINNAAMSLVQLLNDTLSNVLNILFTIIFMFVYSITLSSIVFPITMIFVGISWWIVVSARKPYIKLFNTFGELNGYVEEMLRNAKVTQSFDRQEDSKKEFKRYALKIKKDAFVADSYAKFFDAWITIFSNFLVLVLIIVALALKHKNINFLGVVNGNAEPAALIIGYVGLLFNFTTTIQIIFNIILFVQIGVASTTRISKLVNLTPPAPIDDPIYLDENTKGHIEFTNVSFKYTEDSPKYQLKNATFTALPGQTIAIVGPTGAGKTTIINILSKFYDYNAGSIKIDGIELDRIPKENLRDTMAVVLQDSFMFNDTVYNNLKVANPKATRQDVLEAATITGAHTFIMRYENGYETMIENNGENLSLGERQLLSITRAILGNKKILVLDEATSNVDSNTEKIIQEALSETILKGKTSFVIAHRLSTIRNADVILVLKDGEIIEKGNHDELMNQKGYYYSLHDVQFKENQGK